MTGKIRQNFTLDEIINALAEAKGSKTDAAAALGVDRKTLAYWVKQEILNVVPTDEYQPKIWIYDIETSFLMAEMWGMWQMLTTIHSINQDFRLLTWAGKWYGTDKIISDTAFEDTNFTGCYTDINDRRIVLSLMDMLEEADVVVAHNGNKFDQKKTHARAITLGRGPASPYKQIDTLNIAKQNFAFTSNKLEWIAQLLCGHGKIKTDITLWQGCLQGDIEKWEEMLTYNERDVTVLEDVWVVLAPWDKRSPSFAAHGDREVEQCTSMACGSLDVSRTGKTVKTGLSAFPGWKCNTCGHHMRGRKNLRTKEQMTSTLMNAV